MDPNAAKGGFNPDEFTNNVTEYFLYWMAGGFFLQMLAIAAAIISCIAVMINSQCLTKCTVGFLGCIQCIGGLGWFIAGSVYRWRTSGMICSGVSENPVQANFGFETLHGQIVDFEHIPGALISTGNFIQIFLIICYSLCGCCCVLSVCAAICGKKG